MPSLEPIPPRSISRIPPDSRRGSFSVVQELLSRQAPWEPEELRSAAAAIEEMLSRWERYVRSNPGKPEVEPSPHLSGALKALKDALAASTPEAGT